MSFIIFRRNLFLLLIALHCNPPLSIPVEKAQPDYLKNCFRFPFDRKAASEIFFFTPFHFISNSPAKPRISCAAALVKMSEWWLPDQHLPDSGSKRLPAVLSGHYRPDSGLNRLPAVLSGHYRPDSPDSSLHPVAAENYLPASALSLQ